MRAIRGVVKIGHVDDATLWAMWISQWQGVMRWSDILRPADQKPRRWDAAKDTHIGRFNWEVVDPNTHHGCSLRMRWKMKPIKTHHSGEKGFEKTFLVYHKEDTLSAAAAIEFMLSMRKNYKKNDPLFIYVLTGKEVTLVTSRKRLVDKIAEASLRLKFIK